jgi:hypothetical protein
MEAEKADAKAHRAFVSGDPVTKLFNGSLRVSRWIVVSTIVFGLNIPVVLIAGLNQALFDQGERTGLLHDYAWWIYQVSSVPATILFFLWMPEGIQEVLAGLRRNRTVLPPNGREESEAFHEFITRFDRSYSHFLWVILCVVIVTLFIVLAVVPEHTAFMGWQTSGPVLFWYHEAYWSLVFLLGTLIIVRVMISIYWFNRLFREFRVDVKVLHPDGAGGLAPLGAFSTKVGYLIGIFGLASLAAGWSHSAYLLKGHSLGLGIEPALVSMLFVYLIVAPIVFFAPIGSAHGAMRTAKDSFLLSVADQFETDFLKVEAALASSSSELSASIDKIEQLEKIHGLASRFPVWPFNTASLVRFFSSTLSPLLLALIPSLVTLLIQKLGG